MGTLLFEKKTVSKGRTWCRFITLYVAWRKWIKRGFSSLSDNIKTLIKPIKLIDWKARRTKGSDSHSAAWMSGIHCHKTITKAASRNQD